MVSFIVAASARKSGNSLGYLDKTGKIVGQGEIAMFYEVESARKMAELVGGPELALSIVEQKEVPVKGRKYKNVEERVIETL